MVAAHTVTTIFYLVAKHSSPEIARLQIAEMLRFLDVAAVDRAAILQALTMPYADFEDAVQIAAADVAGADYVVTRDLSDFARGPLPALTPGEALALLPSSRPPATGVHGPGTATQVTRFRGRFNLAADCGP